MEKNYSNMTYGQIEDDIICELLKYDSHDICAWWKFIELMDFIPDEYVLRVLFNVVYSGYNFDSDEFYDTLDEILSYETPEQRNQRIKSNTAALQDKIESDGFITVYRGYDELSYDSESALSWTYDIDDALFFGLKKAWLEDGNSHCLITAKIKPEDVLIVIDDDREHEIIVNPDADKMIISDAPIKMTKEEKEDFYNRRKKKSEEKVQQMIDSFKK